MISVSAKKVTKKFHACVPLSIVQEIIVDKDSPSRQLVSREGGERAGEGETF
jgi:hypothetical protein